MMPTTVCLLGLGTMPLIGPGHWGASGSKRPDDWIGGIRSWR